MSAWSWGRLIEIQVDFGREIYLAWQLAQGKRLYADLVYYYGPLSPYFNALLFDLFGVGLRTLMVGNLVIAGLITVVFYLLFRGIAGAFAATVACLVFVLVFACASYAPPNSFNYICPYSHTATHALFIGLVSLLLAGRVNRAPTRPNAFLCGLAVGLAFLTKPEPFVAAGAAVLVGLGLTAWQHHFTRGRALGLVAAWLAGAVLVGLAAFIALRLEMPSQSALLGMLGSWPYLRNQGDALFYRRVMGTDHIAANLILMLRGLSWYGAMLLPLALYVPARKNRVALLGMGAGSLAAAVACTWPKPPNLFLALRPLPIFLVALAIGLGWRLGRNRDAAGLQKMTRKLMLTVFAGLLLGRIALKTSVLDYGFVLAVPGTLILIVALLDWLPAWFGASDHRLVYTGAVLGVMTLAVIVSLAVFKSAYQGSRYPVGNGPDKFLGDHRCEFVVPLLAELRHRLRPGETLCVLPEGIMINYLTRIDSSVPFDCFIPFVLQMFGERRILDSFQARPPDYVVLFHRDTAEHGPRLFGRDYGQELYSWVTECYCPVAEYGHDPMSDDGDGIILMVRDSPDRAGSSSRDQRSRSITGHSSAPDGVLVADPPSQGLCSAQEPSNHNLSPSEVDRETIFAPELPRPLLDRLGARGHRHRRLVLHPLLRAAVAGGPAILRPAQAVGPPGCHLSVHDRGLWLQVSRHDRRPHR